MNVKELREKLNMYADDVEVEFMSYAVSNFITSVGSRDEVLGHAVSHCIFDTPEERKEFLDTLREHLDRNRRAYGEKIVYINGAYE